MRLDFRPKSGIYDLQIKNTSYNRDNGRFECRIKAKGTGADVHQEFYNLTVLTPPHPPVISPGNVAVATEDKPMELTCSSIGGSPDPMITWIQSKKQRNVLQFNINLNLPFADQGKDCLFESNLTVWYRDGSSAPLQAAVLKGGSKDQPTNATLAIVPRREDDGVIFKCVVWNRAMNEGQRLETTTTLNVNCK
ncbi:hypothetical protein GQX74_002123 [Glossina fuscipes]|nr:hypothetical protein GQX74_002123 [Glossina fuscipes]